MSAALDGTGHVTNSLSRAAPGDAGKHTTLPKIKDQDHFRKESTRAKRRAKNARQELRGVAASSSQTPTIKNQAQPRKIKRPSRRSNMEIGRTRTPTIISYNASHVTPPANKSTKWFGIKLLCPPDAQKNNKKCLEYGCQVLAIFSVVIVSSLTVQHKYLLYLQSVTIIKGADKLQALMKIPGCNKTKGAVRKGDIIIIIIVIRKRKSEQEKKGCWRQKINYNMTDERVC